ncbi:MAG: Tex-like N-terminal domain-containing protein, partial [Cyanobacteria bacterium J06659_2]
TELEDLYLPYRPKRRTLATIAREKGLEPLAQWIEGLNQSGQKVQALETEAQKYVNAEQDVNSAADALQGAADILAEAMAERAD